MFSNNIYTKNAIFKCDKYKLILFINKRYLSHFESSQLQANKNATGLDSSIPDVSSRSEVIKSFQLLRTKPKGYDDLEFLKSLSNKTLGNLSLLKSNELCDITEIYSSLSYRNILVLHGISESFYWLCKLKKVKLRELSRFLKSCFLLKYVPNVRYIDAFLDEFNNIHHVKSVGDYLRFLQFLVHSDLWVTEKYIRYYLKFYEHCTENFGMMSHCHLSSFIQTQLIIDDSDQELFNKLCLNFERNLGESNPSHLKMLINSLLKSKIRDLPIPFARVLKYYLNDKTESISPELAISSLSLLSKFYYRDTECLNKLGLLISNRIKEYSLLQLAQALNHFSSLSYKHKQLIISVSQISLVWYQDDLFSKLNLMSSLSNLVCKVKYYQMDSVNSIAKNSTDNVNEINRLIGNGTNEYEESTEYIESDAHLESNVDNCLNTYDLLFKKNKLHSMTNVPKTIITTSNYLDSVISIKEKDMVFYDNNVKKEITEEYYNKIPRKSILRKLTRKIECDKKPKNKNDNNDELVVTENKLKYIPESTDIIRVQSISEYFKNFYSMYFNGIHPAYRRLNNRKSMDIQLEKYNNLPEFKNSKSLSKVYHENKYKNEYNYTIRKIKYKMKYSGSRLIQPTTYYINQTKILKRIFLKPYIKISKEYNKIRDNNNYNRNNINNSNKDGEDKKNNINDNNNKNNYDGLIDLNSIIGNNSVVYVDNKLTLKPICDVNKFKYKTRKIYRKIIRLSNKVDNIIDYLISNKLWSYDSKEVLYKQICLIEYVANIMDSLSRMNFISYQLVKVISEGFVDNCIKGILMDYSKQHVNNGIKGDNILKECKETNEDLKSYNHIKSNENDNIYIDKGKFINSINKILGSLKIVFFTDKSRVILNRFSDLICSDDFVSLVDKYFGSINHIENKICIKLFGNLCKISFYKYIRNNNTNKDYDNLMELVDERKKFTTLLSTIKNLISVINNINKNNERDVKVKKIKKIDKLDLNNKSVLELFNNIVYLSWFISTIKKNNIFNLKKELQQEYSSYISEVSNNYVYWILKELDEYRFDTHLLINYLGVVDKYIQIVKIEENTEKNGLEDNRGVINESKDYENKEKDNKNKVSNDYVSNVEYWCRNIMNKYNINENMIKNIDENELNNKNNMINNRKMRNLNYQMEIYNKYITDQPQLYKYYYKYYCNL